jgi:hypothetical protein
LRRALRRGGCRSRHCPSRAELGERAGQDLFVQGRVGEDVLAPHAADEHAFDAAFRTRHQRLLDQRHRLGDAGRRLGLAHDLLPVGQAPAIAVDDGMSVQADDLVEQLGAKAVHHAHHDDQRGDAEHDGDQADAGDQEDEAFALAGRR